MTSPNKEREIITYLVPYYIKDLKNYKGDVRTLIGEDITLFYKTFSSESAAAHYFEINEKEVCNVANNWYQIGSNLRDSAKRSNRLHHIPDSDETTSECASRIFLPISSLSTKDRTNYLKLYIECEISGYFDCYLKKRVVFMYKDHDHDLPEFYNYLNNPKFKQEEISTDKDQEQHDKKELESEYSKDDAKYAIIAKFISKMSEADVKYFLSMIKIKEEYEYQRTVSSDDRIEMLDDKLYKLEKRTNAYIKMIMES